MKTILFSLFILFNLTMSYGQGKVVEDSIYVYGNCEMCKRTIETSLEKPGIKVAEWNEKTKQLFVAYRPDKITEQEIHETVAAVGYDTKKVKAKDEVYAALPFCCLYRNHNPEEDGNSHDEKPHH